MEAKDKYAVIGNPVEHSLSPTIHKMFAEQTNQQMNYDKILSQLDGFIATVQKFIGNGGNGANVTVPFKQDAFAIANEVSDRAKAAGAVNTLRFESDGNIYADNTDGVGLVRDITQNLKAKIKGKSILLIGAGGAAMGVTPSLLVEKPKSLLIVNRTVSKAERLAASTKSDLVSACGFDKLGDQQFDVVINSTSTGLHNAELPLPGNILQSTCLCYEMMYGKDATPFMKWAKKQGADLIVDGLGMLVEQAAESFYIWRKIRPDTKPVLHFLRTKPTEKNDD